MVRALDPGRLGASVSEIFREIDEELRRENLLKLWQRYGRYIIAAVVLVVLLAGGILAWLDYQAKERRAQGARYSAALSLARQGKDAEAAKLFAQLARDGGGYSIPGAFEEAEMLARGGDRKAAVAAYDRLASSGIDRDFRELAVLLSVMHALSDSDPKAMIDRLAPLTQKDNAWRASALDLTAAAKLKGGDRAGALQIYQELADDPGVPRGLRARAAEMAAALKS
jgi:hypothetical protein